LILAILNIETNEGLLALLAAGLLEDVIGMEVIDGVWCSNENEHLKARLNAIVGGRH
jgi:CRISPR/Cas system-associated protein Cas7 (RAMP superfamily)